MTEHAYDSRDQDEDRRAYATEHDGAGPTCDELRLEMIRGLLRRGERTGERWAWEYAEAMISAHFAGEALEGEHPAGDHWVDDGRGGRWACKCNGEPEGDDAAASPPAGEQGREGQWEARGGVGRPRPTYGVMARQEAHREGVADAQGQRLQGTATCGECGASTDSGQLLHTEDCQAVGRLDVYDFHAASTTEADAEGGGARASERADADMVPTARKSQATFPVDALYEGGLVCWSDLGHDGDHEFVPDRVAGGRLRHVESRGGDICGATSWSGVERCGGMADGVHCGDLHGHEGGHTWETLVAPAESKAGFEAESGDDPTLPSDRCVDCGILVRRLPTLFEPGSRSRGRLETFAPRESHPENPALKSAEIEAAASEPLEPEACPMYRCRFGVGHEGKHERLPDPPAAAETVDPAGGEASSSERKAVEA